MPRWTLDVTGFTVYSDDVGFTLDEITTATTLTGDHTIIIANATSDIIITLPAATSHTDRIYTIKNIGTNKVTIDANSTEKIDGEETIVLNLQYSYVTIVCDGDEWFIIGGEYVKMEDLLREILSVEEKVKKLLQEIEKHLGKIRD